MSEAKEKLLQLEKEGKYLFHGSPAKDIKELEPRQAHTIPRGEKDMVKDGEPGVAATPYSEIAIFRAIVTKGRSSFSVSGFSLEDKVIEFKANKKALELAKGKFGYVYVLNRNSFTRKSGFNKHAMEWRSVKPIKPVRVFTVNYEDLPKNITIIEYSN